MLWNNIKINNNNININIWNNILAHEKISFLYFHLFHETSFWCDWEFPGHSTGSIGTKAIAGQDMSAENSAFWIVSNFQRLYGHLVLNITSTYSELNFQ